MIQSINSVKQQQKKLQDIIKSLIFCVYLGDKKVFGYIQI